MDDIFVKLPPPEPSRSGYSSSSSSGYSAPVASMSVYHSCSNPCFAGESLVEMAADVSTTKRVDCIKKGDRVKVYAGYSDNDNNNNDNTAEVVCVVKTHCEGGKAQLVQLEGGLLVTPYHPVRRPSDDSWHFPCELGEVRERECSAVYSFVLSTGHVMCINGVMCVTLGHGLDSDEIVRHQYFGSASKVIEDLKNVSMEGWTAGLVELYPGCLVRDAASGLVCGIRQGSKQPQASMNAVDICCLTLNVINCISCLA